MKKDAEEKKISRADLEVLIRIVNEIVAMHIKYIKRGFSIKDIAQTFSQLYHRQLQKVFDRDPEVVKMAKLEMMRENKAYAQLGQSPKEVVSSICIQLSAAFIGAVTNIRSKNTKPR